MLCVGMNGEHHVPVGPKGRRDRLEEILRQGRGFVGMVGRLVPMNVPGMSLMSAIIAVVISAGLVPGLGVMPRLHLCLRERNGGMGRGRAGRNVQEADHRRKGDDEEKYGAMSSKLHA